MCIRDSDYKLQEHNRSKEGVAEEIPFSDAVSFYEILKDQLQMQELTPEQRDICLLYTSFGRNWLISLLFSKFQAVSLR